MSLRFCASLACVVHLSMLVSVASAQIEGAASDGDAADETIVITATRTLRPLDRVGSTVTVIDAADLALHQDRLLVDALERVPGITVRRDSDRPGSRVAVFMRGADSDQTQVLLDGVLLHDPSAPNREAFLDHLGVEDVERIEIVRGPQSVLYGSDAIGGVINIITRKGADRLEGALRMEGGSFSSFDFAATARGATDDFYYAASVVRRQTDGFSVIDEPEVDDLDGYASTSAHLRLGAGDADLGIDGTFYLLDALTDFDVFSPAVQEIAKSDSRQVLLALVPHATLLGGLWEQRLRATFNWTERDNRGKDAGPEDFLPTSYESALYELDWQHVLEIAEGFTTVLGAEFGHESGTFDISRTFPAPVVEAEANRGSLYADEQVSLGKYFSWTGGVRLELHDEFGSDLVGRTTVAILLGDLGTSLHGSLGTGFKAPTLAQLFDDSFGSANPDLRPENSLGWDIGFRQPLGTRGNLELTWFGNEIDDLIYSVDLNPGFFVFSNVNIDSVQTSGLELGFAYALLEGAPWLGDLSTNLSYTYTRTRAKDDGPLDPLVGGRLLRRPEHEVYVDWIWSPVPQLEAVLNLLYVGERLDLDPVLFTPFEADSFVTVGLAVNVQLRDWVEVFFRAENLADEAYENVAGFQSAGRSYYGGVRLNLP